MTILQTGDTVSLSLSAGESLVIKDLSGTATVTGSSSPKEGARAAIGDGFTVYGPQLTDSTVVISTTGMCDYHTVRGDPTPSDSGQVVATFAGGRSGYEESTIVQEQINDLHSTYGRRGAVIKVPHKTYSVLKGVTLQPGIMFVSDQLYTPFSEGTSEAAGPRFVLPTSCNQPMFTNAIGVLPDVLVRGVSDGEAQVYACNGFVGINFIGSLDATKHTTNADLIRIFKSWNWQIYGCSFFNCRGFAVRTLNSNVIRIINNQFNNCAMFHESLADSRIIDNDMFNGGSAAACAIWLAGAAGTTHKNIIRGNLSGNNQSNGFVTHPDRQFAPNLRVTAVDTTTGELTLAEYGQFAALALGHLWADGTPVCFGVDLTWNTSGGDPAKSGTLPAGYNESYTYYVKVTAANKLKLARSRLDLDAGAYVIPSNVGSGTFYLNVGKQAAIFVNDGAQGNVFESGRIDQAYGASLMFDGAVGNTVSGALVQEGSMGNFIGSATAGGYTYEAPVEQPAVQLINGSTGNKITATIEGTKVGVLGGTGRESRQKWGVFIDASSEDSSWVSADSNIYNHNSATSSAGAADFYDDRYNPNQVWMYAQDFYSVSGSTPPALQAVGGGREFGWCFSNGIDSVIGGSIVIPHGWKHIDVYAVWTCTAATAGNVVWHMDIGAFDVGANINVADVATADIAGTSGGQDILNRTQLSQLTWTGKTGKRARVRMKRVGTSGSDTLAGKVHLIGLLLVRRF